MPQVKAGLARSPTCWVVFVQDNQLIHQCLSVIRVQPVNPFQFLHGLIRAIESSLGLVQKRLASMWNVRVGVSDPSCPNRAAVPISSAVMKVFMIVPVPSGLRGPLPVPR